MVGRGMGVPPLSGFAYLTFLIGPDQGVEIVDHPAGFQALIRVAEGLGAGVFSDGGDGGHDVIAGADDTDREEPRGYARASA